MPNRDIHAAGGGAELARDLARRAALEELVARTSRRFIGLEPIDFDAATNGALQDIGSFVGADRSYIFLYDRATGTMSNTHEWCAAGIEPQRDSLQDLPMDVFRWVIDTLEHEMVLDIGDPDALEDEPTREILKEQDIQSLVLVSVRTRTGEAVGFIGFDAVRHQRPWEAEDADLLEVVGSIISAGIDHQRILAELTASEARHRATLDAVPDLIFILDGDARVIGYQAPRSYPLAVSERDVVGTSAWDILAPEDHRGLSLAMIEAGEAGQGGSFSYTLTRGGEKQHFEGRVTRRAANEYLVLVRDVTEKMRADSALRRLALQLTSAEEEQRRDLAVQLHEGIGQELTGLMFRLQNLRGSLGDRTAEAEQVTAAMNVLQEAMRHTQELTFDLSPPVLYELGLEAALRALVVRFDEQEDIAFQLTATGETQNVDHPVGILLYRIARELLINVVKHSGATGADVILEQSPSRLTLSVHDNGCGLAQTAPDVLDSPGRGGFGLYSIRQRLAPLGGELHIEAGQGANVRVVLPLIDRLADTSMEAVP